MMATSFSELLMILVAAYGGTSADLVSLIDPAEYFKARDVFVTPDKMMVLVDAEPTDTKSELSRLLALRWLAAHPDDAYKAEKSLATLKAVAAGKKGEDPHGFAREYAQRVIAKIEGKGGPAPRPLPAGSLRSDALSWFPADVTFCGGIDLRASGPQKAAEEVTLHALFKRVLAGAPEAGVQEKLYELAEAVGNVRVDRFAMAVRMPPGKTTPERIYVRFTGVCDPKRCAAYLGGLLPGAVVDQKKGPGGEPITMLSRPGSGPAFAFVGNTDVIVAGYGDDKARHLDVVEHVLKTRAEDKGSAADGPLSAMLKQVPERSYGLVAGDLPPEMLKEMTSGGSPFKVFPKRFCIDLTRDKDIVVHLDGKLKDADEAKTFAESVNKLKQQGIEALKNPPPGIPLPAAAAKLLGDTLEGAKLEAKGDAVSGRMPIGVEVFKMLPSLLWEARPVRPAPSRRFDLPKR